MTEPLLSVQNLTMQFHTADGPAIAVDDVSFAIGKGETLALVGESGSGKTVTALSILRLIDKREGTFGPASRVEFEGANILTLPAEPLRQIRGARIAMIFQEPQASLNPVLTVGSQIAETIRAHESVTRRQAWERSVGLLKEVGIADPERRSKEYPHQMSGGMQQRVMIAMALSCRPSLLIADEPTTALDVTIQAQILELLIQLQRRFDMAMLFITHNLSVVSEIADRIAVMYAGQIVEVAPADQLFSEPRHPYTQALLKAIPRVDQTRPNSGIPGTAPPITERGVGCRFYERCEVRLNECKNRMPELTPTDTKDTEVRCILASQETTVGP